MNLSRIIARRVVQGWKEYNLARNETELEYYKERVAILDQLIQEGQKDIRQLKGGNKN